MNRLSPDHVTITRAIDAVERKVLEHALDHRIYREADMQTVVIASLLRFLEDGEYDTQSILLLNTSYLRRGREKSYPDVVITYHSKIMHIIELKESINGHVSELDIKKDFINNQLLNDMGIRTTVMLLSMENDNIFEKLNKEYQHTLCYNVNVVLAGELRKHKIETADWRKAHTDILSGVEADLARLLARSMPKSH